MRRRFHRHPNGAFTFSTWLGKTYIAVYTRPAFDFDKDEVPSLTIIIERPKRHFSARFEGKKIDG